MVRRLVCAVVMLAACTSATAASYWQPRKGTSFAIFLSVSPASVTTPAQAVDLDLFDTKAATVAELKRQGKKVICYLSAGSWENWRPDKASFPPAIRGNAYDGWPGERWLDIRSERIKAPMLARLDLCRQKGFDAVDADNVDSYQANTGFAITRADAVRYLRFLAAAAHARGLAFGLKNATDLSAAVLNVMDFAVTEDCFDQGWCRQSGNFISANKPVFAIEYTDNGIDFAAFCRQAKTLGLSPLYKKRNLGTWEKRCP